MEEEKRFEWEELQRQEWQTPDIPSMDDILWWMQIGWGNADQTLMDWANWIPGQIPQASLQNWNWSQQQTFWIYDLIIVLWLAILFFVIYSVYYFFNGDTLYQIIWILVLIILYKILFFSKRQINTISALLILFLVILVLYTTVNTINFRLFTLSTTLITVWIIFFWLYNWLNFDFNFWKNKTQQSKPVIQEDTKPEINEEPEENKIQLWDNLVSQYEEEFTQDIEENVTNTLADRIVALLWKWYNILFSPNTRKFLEFYYIINKEEIVYPDWLVEGFWNPTEEIKGEIANTNDDEGFENEDEDNNSDWEDEDDDDDEWENEYNDSDDEDDEEDDDFDF